MAIIIGGSGYHWRGRAIRMLKKDNMICAVMPRRESMIMVPCLIERTINYKISLIAAKNGGNGLILVNFFAGKNYDSRHIPISVASGDFREHNFVISVPAFPKNIPIYFRVWRPDNANGSVIIKSIKFDKTGEKPTDTKPPVIKVTESVNKKTAKKIKTTSGEQKKVVITAPIKKEEKKKKQSKIEKVKITANKVRESLDMKFKPFIAKRITSPAEEVLIQQKEDVPKVCIITPTRDNLEGLKRCYKALNENTSYQNWEWIIGDSASTDGTADYIKGLSDERIKLVERGTTEGSFSSINNELVRQADGQYLLFLNDDTEPQPFWLFEMMSKIHRNPEIGIVGAKLLYSKDRIQHAGIAMTPAGPANLGKAVLSSFPKGFAEHDRYFQAVTGACLLIRSEDFCSVGGFDPIYYFCYEDVDLCLKVKTQLNKKILYAANAQVIHAESVTQKKFKTAGELQQNGIKIFKERWMRAPEIDFEKYQKNSGYNVKKIDISFITCVNHIAQYRNYVVGSLFNSKTTKNYETIPILNFGNKYSAARALNLGLEKARGNVIVFCHQDVLFYSGWVDMLYDRIIEIEKKDKKWGVLGTAGINKRDDTAGVVHNMKGDIQWRSTKRAKVYPVQTVDEHCMIIRKGSGLRFDSNVFNGFHFYGPDICLLAMSKGMINYGILCPLVHCSGSGSLASGKKEFFRLFDALSRKWKYKFGTIRTTTSFINKGSKRTWVKFND